jgi:glycosyltransferase involved in cell wall biosynthesis
VTHAPRVLLVVSADTARDRNGGPRRDYAAVAEIVGAAILDRSAVDRSALARLLRRVGGLALAQAWLAFQLRGRYDIVITDGEHVGIPLALLLRCSRAPIGHITIGHRLSATKKRRFFTVLRAHARMDRIVLHSRHQFDFAQTELGIPLDRLALVPYQVDVAFWAPSQIEEELLIVSAGLEYRDYATLFRAVEGLEVQVVVGAASSWARRALDAGPPPANVRIGAFDYDALRSLYARAAMVVVPLVDVDNQAGVTTILEAMAMGKAVVVTQSLGQTDVVEDRRADSRGEPRPRPTSLLRIVATRSGLSPEPNGFYVPPGQPAMLRRAIAFLLGHPEERARLGAAGRRAAEQLLTVEHFADRMQAIVNEVIGEARVPRLVRRVWDG